MTDIKDYPEESWQEGLRDSLLSAITHTYPTQLGNMQHCLVRARLAIEGGDRERGVICLKDAVAYFETGDTEEHRAQSREEQEEEKNPEYDSPSVISLFNDPSWIVADIANTCAIARKNPRSSKPARLIPTEEQVRQTGEFQSDFIAAYIEPFHPLYENLKSAMNHLQSLSGTDNNILMAEALKRAFDSAEELSRAFNQMPTKEARIAALRHKIPLDQIAAVCRAKFAELTRGT